MTSTQEYMYKRRSVSRPVLWACGYPTILFQGMYPALVMILVNYQRSSKALVSTSNDNNLNFDLASSKTAPLGSLRFNDGPADRSRNMTNTMRTEHSTVHVTLDTHNQESSLGAVSEEDGQDEASPGRKSESEYDWRRVQFISV